MKRVTFGLTLAIAFWLPGLATAVPPSAPPASAGAPPRTEPSAHSIQLAKRLFAAQHLDTQMNSMMTSLLPVFAKDMAKQMPDVGADGSTAIVEATKGALAEWFPRYMDRMAVEYARVLSDDELQAAVTFYESPVGKSIIDKLGAMAPVATRVMLEMRPQLQILMFERLCRRIDCAKLRQPSNLKSS
jgi:hypothetical protein